MARSTCKSGKLSEEEGHHSVRDLVREKWTGHYAAEIEGRGARVTLGTAASWIEPQKRERERSGPPANREKRDKNPRKMKLAEFLIF